MITLAENPSAVRVTTAPDGSSLRAYYGFPLSCVDVLPKNASLPPGVRPPAPQERHLSPSQIEKITYCGMQWYYKYVVGKADRLTSRQFKGSCTHAAAEAWFRGILNGMDPLLQYQDLLELAIDEARAYFKREIPNDILLGKRWQKGPSETRDTLIEDIVVGVRKLAEASWSNITPSSVEQGYVLRFDDARPPDPNRPGDKGWPGTWPIHCYLDVAEISSDGSGNKSATIYDFKTGKWRNQTSADLNCGLTSYCLAHEVSTGIPTRKAALHCLVTNKELKFLPLPTTRTNTDFIRLYNRAVLAQKAIMEGNYLPDDGDHCEDCSFRAQCRSDLGRYYP